MANVLSWLNDRLSATEKVFLSSTAAVGLWFAVYGEEYFSSLYAATNAGNYGNFLLNYYFFDPLFLLLLWIGYVHFGRWKGLLSTLGLVVAYDLMFYKGTATASEILIRYAPTLPFNVGGVTFAAAFYGFVLPLVILTLVAVFNNKFFDRTFSLEYIQ